MIENYPLSRGISSLPNAKNFLTTFTDSTIECSYYPYFRTHQTKFGIILVS